MSHTTRKYSTTRKTTAKRFLLVPTKRRSREKNPTWNITSAVRITGALNVGALERAITEVVGRHEALRARFVVEGQTPAQIFLPPSDMPLRQTDLRALPEADLPAAIAWAAHEQREEETGKETPMQPACRH